MNRAQGIIGVAVLLQVSGFAWRCNTQFDAILLASADGRPIECWTSDINRSIGSNTFRWWWSACQTVVCPRLAARHRSLHDLRRVNNGTRLSWNGHLDCFKQTDLHHKAAGRFKHLISDAVTHDCFCSVILILTAPIEVLVENLSFRWYKFLFY